MMVILVKDMMIFCQMIPQNQSLNSEDFKDKSVINCTDEASVGVNLMNQTNGLSMV